MIRVKVGDGKVKETASVGLGIGAEVGGGS